MKKLAAILILLSGVAQAQNICISPTGTTTSPNCTASEALEVAITGVSGVELPNDTYLTATDAAGTGTIDVLKVTTSDDTELNCSSNDVFLFKEGGTTGLTYDPSTNGFTFASPAELGSNSTSDAISAAYFSDGTGKALLTFDAFNNLQLWTVTSDDLIFGVAGAKELVLNATGFYPNSTGGNALGSSSYGWNGLYLSDGTDKWSFVPGTNLLTLAAGADDQTAKICGGSAAATTNGACVNLLGDDVGGADAGGDLEFRPSDNAAAVSKFYTPGASLAWSVGANITQDASSGGNIVMTKAGTYVKAPSFISDSTDVGWVVRAGADTACTTTCGANKGCLFGIDAGTAAVVACATATADTCLCSQ